MKTEQQQGKPQIIFLGGYLCSGKTTYINRNLKEYERIGVSDIVRQITSFTTRQQLQSTSQLSKEIANRICDVILTNKYKKFVIDGIRQSSIFTHIINYLHKYNYTYEIIWLDVSKEECRRRFEAKSDKKENISFNQAFENDSKLGLLELERYWKLHSCTIVKND